MSNENVHPIFKDLLDDISRPRPTNPFDILAENHFDIWVNNNEESYDKEHATISVKFAIDAIDDIVLRASHPGDILDQIQIKRNELKLMLNGADKSE